MDSGVRSCSLAHLFPDQARGALGIRDWARLRLHLWRKSDCRFQLEQFLRTDRTAQSAFNRILEAKPASTEFVSQLAERVRRETQEANRSRPPALASMAIAALIMVVITGVFIWAAFMRAGTDLEIAFPSDGQGTIRVFEGNVLVAEGAFSYANGESWRQELLAVDAPDRESLVVVTNDMRTVVRASDSDNPQARALNAITSGSNEAVATLVTIDLIFELLGDELTKQEGAITIDGLQFDEYTPKSRQVDGLSVSAIVDDGGVYGAVARYQVVDSGPAQFVIEFD